MHTLEPPYPIRRLKPNHIILIHFHCRLQHLQRSPPFIIHLNPSLTFNSTTLSSTSHHVPLLLSPAQRMQHPIPPPLQFLPLNTPPPSTHNQRPNNSTRFIS